MITFLIWLLIAILWGAFIGSYWLRESSFNELDGEHWVAITLLGLIWPLSLPFYILRWSIQFLGERVFSRMWG